MVSFIERFHSIQDRQLSPNGVLYREVSLYKCIVSGAYSKGLQVLTCGACVLELLYAFIHPFSVCFGCVQVPIQVKVSVGKSWNVLQSLDKLMT